MATTHFSGPILYSGKPASRAWFKDCPVSQKPDDTVLFDDFVGVALDSTNDWTVVKDSGASVAIAADVVGGRALLSSTATTDDDGSSVQGNEIFAAASGRSMWFETKLQSSDADQQEICAGFTVNFATNPEAMLTAADRICFQVADGDASILCKTEKSGTETSTDSGVDLTDATDVTLSILVEGTGVVYFFVNRSLVATHTTNIPDDENLTVGLMQLSGNDTGTKSMSVDYVFAAQTR